MHFTMSEWLMRMRRFIKRATVIDYNGLEWRKQSLPLKDDFSEKTSEHNDTAFDENSHGAAIHNDGCLVENVSGNRDKMSQRQESNLSLHCVSSNQLTENTNSCDHSTWGGIIFKGGFYFSIIRLIRAGDVETNPGPYGHHSLGKVPPTCYDQLSQQFPANKYTQLSTLLGIANQANTILVQCENDYQKATRHVLSDWHKRMQNSGTVADLKTAITGAGAGELNCIIDESVEEELELEQFELGHRRRLLRLVRQRRQQQQQQSQTYKAALGSGKALCKRSRLMVVGPAGVGKTSLIRRLTGKSFNSEEQSTVGVEISSVDKEEVHGWKPESKGHRDDMAEALAHLTETDSQGTSLETMGAVGGENPQQKSILEEKMTKLLPLDIHKRVRLQRRSFQSGGITYNILDFGGQGIYYTTHPLFFSWRSLYIVVFDLRTKLEEPPSRVEHIQDGNMTLVPLFLRTTQRVLHFWLMSIHVHAAPPKEMMTTDSKYDPRILLACTFKNDVTKEEAKVQTDKLRDMIKGQPYAHQVIDRMVEVDNASSPEDEILKLRDLIDKETMDMPHMKEELPIRWHTFADELDKLNETGNSCPCLTMEQVRRMMIPLGIDEEQEVKMVLQFYHDTGRLVYHQGCNIIVLDPQWLNDVFKKIICVCDEKKERGPLREHWKKYHMKGVLSRELIAHVWQDLVTNPSEVLKMLMKLDLICAIPGREEYFVPCRSSLKRGSEERLEDNDKFSFIIDFDDFLPVGYLHRFFVRMARWALDQGGPMPTFHFLEMIFYLDEKHRVVLENDPNGDKPNQIQVTIQVPNTDEDNDTTRPLRVNREFIDWIDETLMDLKEAWARGISFSICVPCLNCKKHGKKSLVPLKNFWAVGKEATCCENCPAVIPTRKIQKIFLSDQDNPGQPEVSGVPPVANRHEISEIMLRDLAQQLGEEWRSVGTYLGLQNSEIQALREEFSSLKECMFQMLLEWRNRNGVYATKVELKRVLTKAGRADLEDIVDIPN